MREPVQVRRIAARPDVQPVGDGVAHRPRGEKQRRLEPEQLGDPLLKRQDRRILEALFVAHLGGRDGRPHAF
jgi:hypothetical protein